MSEQHIYLTKDELQSILKNTTSLRDKLLILLAYRKALRVTEAVSIKKADINLLYRTIYINRVKSSVSREYRLEDDEVRLLKRYLKTTDPYNPYLFQSQKGGKLHRVSGLRIFKQCCERAGIQEHKHFFHVLKHTIGTHLSDSLVPVQLIQTHLGHKALRNTMIYVKATTKASDTAYQNALLSGQLV